MPCTTSASFRCAPQARDDILNGSHPVSFDKACEFAGFQCQIQFGPHNEQKHKAGFLDLKDFLPKEYVKQKGERKIFQVNGGRGTCLGCLGAWLLNPTD